MKALPLKTLLMVVIGQMLIGCGGSSGGATDLISVTDPNALTNALTVKLGGRSATLLDGALPAPTNLGGDPAISPLSSASAVAAGEKVTLEVSVDSVGLLSGLLFKVRDADRYFEFNLGGGARKASFVDNLEVEVPSNVTDGRFCVDLVAIDSDDKVSSSVQTCIDVGGAQALAAPRLIGELPLVDATDLSLGDQLVFVSSSSESAVVVVDVSDPSRPVEVVRRQDEAGFEFAITQLGGYVFGTSGSVLGIYEVANSISVEQVGRVISPNLKTDVVVRSGIAFVAKRAAPLEIVDVSSPSEPTILARSAAHGDDDAQGIALSENLALLASGERGVDIVDVSTPAAPVDVALIDTPGFARKAFAVGDLLYVADDSEGVAVVDITAPSAPKTIASVAVPGLAMDVVVRGDFAYVSTPTEN